VPSGPATVSAFARLEATTLSRYDCALTALPDTLNIWNMLIIDP
jgi:hypothetical protein